MRFRGRGGLRDDRAVDGDVQRFRGGDRGGRDDGSRRHGDLREPGEEGGMKGLGFIGAGDMGGAKGQLCVASAAGVPPQTFLSARGEGARVVRAMPNTPAQVGMGSTGLFFVRGVSREQKEWARKIFSSFGEVAEFPREELLDVVTALSGSGPAYAFLFIEALADGAVRAGMGREEAVRLAAATVEGAARMVRTTGKHPGELKDMVTSPGGTTAAGIAALEMGAFRGTVLSAVFAAWQRCRELST